jgi:hypothetical protein
MRVMRIGLIGAVLIGAAVFVTGYVVGQIHGATGSSAATTSNPTRMHGLSSSASRAFGKVTAVNGNTITISPNTNFRNKTSSVTTIVLTSSTKYVSGWHSSSSSGTKPTISVGSFVVAEGTLSSNGKTLTAARFSVVPSVRGSGPGGFHGFGGFGLRAVGTVSAISSDTITIKPMGTRPNGMTSVTTVKLTSSTLYNAGRGSSSKASKSSIKVGSFIIAQGTLSSDGKTITASRVSILPSAPSAGGTPWFHGNGPGFFHDGYGFRGGSNGFINGPFSGQSNGNI